MSQSPLFRPTPTPTPDTLIGVVERVTFHNPESGYAVLKVSTEDNYPGAVARDGTVTVTGVMPELNIGETVAFDGAWRDDPRFGRQFNAVGVRPVLPTTERGLTRYLDGGLVKGMGERTAQRIVDHFGLDTLHVLNHVPQRLYEVPKLKRELADALMEAWQGAQAERATLVFLQGLGISMRVAKRILDEYGPRTMETVQRDPYQLARDVFGIGFAKADAIAQRMGVPRTSEARLRAGLSHAMSAQANDGHTYAPREVLIARAAELLALPQDAALDAALEHQMAQGELRREMLIGVPGQPLTEAIYLSVFFHAERSAARRLEALARASSTLLRGKVEPNAIDAFLDEVLAAEDSVTLSPQQRQAVRGALVHPLSVLTGGPGTGKTTTLRALLAAALRASRTVLLCAPTGRAAKRLSEATSHPASTIHRMLGYTPGAEFAFEFDEDNPLKVDMLVVDESSMLDLLLFTSLLKAVPPGAHLVLVGDVDQLPSVGAGNVLRDVIDSGLAQVTRLEAIFRQSEDSHITVNAHRINHGQMPLLDNTSRDFYFFRTDDIERAADYTIEIVVDKLPSRFGLDPRRDVQVIAPMYRGPAGVDALNSALQAALNPPGRGVAEVVRPGGQVYRVGDKVIVLKNNYDKNVFNGDMGVVYGLEETENGVQLIVDFDGTWVDYDVHRELDQLALAYCISTHRSQGSEYPAVVAPVVTGHYVMLQRNLLYTAITRAKQLAVLVGSTRAVQRAVDNNQVSARFSGLLPRLRAKATS